MEAKTKVIAARIIGGLVFIIGGSIVQICLWRSVSENNFEALFHWPFLWIVYFFIALLAAEHSLRWMKRFKRW